MVFLEVRQVRSPRFSTDADEGQLSAKDLAALRAIARKIGPESQVPPPRPPDTK